MIDNGQPHTCKIAQNKKNLRNSEAVNGEPHYSEGPLYISNKIIFPQHQLQRDELLHILEKPTEPNVTQTVRESWEEKGEGPTT